MTGRRLAGRLQESSVRLTESFTLGPTYSAAVTAWAEAFGVSRTEALRMIIVCAGLPSRAEARAAREAVVAEREATKAKARAERESRR